MYEMFRLLALARYEERYVIPTAHAEQAHSLEEIATDCAVSQYGGGQEIFGEGSGGAPTPVAAENLRVRREALTPTASTPCRPTSAARTGQPAQLGWAGMPDGIFPGGGSGSGERADR